MSSINFSAVADAAVNGSSGAQNPWGVQVDLERESGLYRHPVTDEPITIGGMMAIANGRIGKETMVKGPNGQRSYRDSVKALLRPHGVRLDRRIKLDAKVKLHAAIAEQFGTAAVKKAARAAVKAL